MTPLQNNPQQHTYTHGKRQIEQTACRTGASGARIWILRETMQQKSGIGSNAGPQKYDFASRGEATLAETGTPK